MTEEDLYKHYKKRMAEAGVAIPVVVKPATEDNSRGVALVRREEELVPALKEAFSYGDLVVAEEYIAGRELRCGVVEEVAMPQTLKVVPISACVEYVMSKDMPIRTATDKLQTSDGAAGMKQTKCERLLP